MRIREFFEDDVFLQWAVRIDLHLLHAGWNENAFIQAIDPKLVHPERYSEAMATPRPPAGTWTAYPFPSSIILYQPGPGYVKFDQAKADAYLKAVVEKMGALVKETIAKWDKAGIFR